MTVQAGPSNELVVRPYAESDKSAFGDVFQPQTTQFKPFFVVLENRSEKPLSLLFALWEYREPSSGASKKIELLYENFQRPGGMPAVPAMSMALLGPGGVTLPEQEGPRVSSLPGAIQSAERLARAESVSFRLPLAMFGDGEVAGQDEAQVLSELRARRAAARAVFDAVQSARQNGLPVSAAVAPFQSRPAPNSITTTFQAQEATWRRRFALEAIRAQQMHLDAFLEYLDKFPPIPETVMK